MKLKEYIDAFGVKQNFLANKIGIAPTALNSYVLGRKIPTIETAWKIHIATNGAVTFEDWLVEEIHIDADARVTQETKKNQVTRPSKK